MMTNAKYGYVITTTPGLIDEGSFPLSARGIFASEVARAIDEPIAVFATSEAAELAMHRLVPENSTPGTYAGLRIASTYDTCPTEIIYSLNLVGMDGFIVPEFAAD